MQHDNEERRQTDAELRSILAQVQTQKNPRTVSPVSAKRESPQESELAEMLLRADTANEDISKRLASCEIEKSILAQQVCPPRCHYTRHINTLCSKIHVLQSQSSTLAAEVDTCRREKVWKMFDQVNFVDAKFEPKPLVFAHPQLIISALPPVSLSSPLPRSILTHT